jgi:hypothetical protein
MKPTRICPECSGAIQPNERRCPCLKYGLKKWNRPKIDGPKFDSLLSGAHFYHLMLSVRSGSWAQTGYRAARKPDRDIKKAMTSGLQAGGFSIDRQRIFRPFIDVQFFAFRCEISHAYWRNEFDGLMGNRLILWLGGCSKKTTCDYLQISRASLKWLDREIRQYVRFPGRARGQNAEYLKARRKMKAGVAADIIRRKKVGYKQGQSLTVQQPNPFDQAKSTIYEGTLNARPTANRNPAPADSQPSAVHYVRTANAGESPSAEAQEITRNTYTESENRI